MNASDYICIAFGCMALYMLGAFSGYAVGTGKPHEMPRAGIQIPCPSSIYVFDSGTGLWYRANLTADTPSLEPGTVIGFMQCWQQ